MNTGIASRNKSGRGSEQERKGKEPLIAGEITGKIAGKVEGKITGNDWHGWPKTCRRHGQPSDDIASLHIIW
ncbi:MAG: hypothetical protein R6U32_01545 [Candidatus Woesearchaeota archaeon]